MSRRLIIRPEAEEEMANAFDWYEGCALGLGSDFLLCVDAIFNFLFRTSRISRGCKPSPASALFEAFQSLSSAKTPFKPSAVPQ